MDRPPPNIRPATEADVSELARVHVECWRETYAGLLPDPILRAMSVPDRANAWLRVIRGELLPGSQTFVVEEGRSIVGLASCCPQRDASLAAAGYDGEVSAIYLLREVQRRHLGTELMRTAARALNGLGSGGMSVWVLRQNASARAFYERLGAVLISDREEDRHGAALGEVAYGWSSAREFADDMSALRSDPNVRSCPLSRPGPLRPRAPPLTGPL